jgi:hypothetical protein
MRDSAGYSTANGVDIIDVISSGPHRLDTGAWGNYSFAILAAETLQDLQRTADSLQLAFDQNALKVENPASPAQVKIYPNPAQDRLQISLPEQVEEIRIFNLQGRLVAHVIPGGNINNLYSVNINQLKNGIYFIELITPTNRLRHKFAVLR